MKDKQKWLKLKNINNGLGLTLTYTKVKKVVVNHDLEERKIIFHFFVNSKDIVNREGIIGEYCNFIGSFWEDKYEDAEALLEKFGFTLGK